MSCYPGRAIQHRRYAPAIIPGLIRDVGNFPGDGHANSIIKSCTHGILLYGTKLYFPIIFLLFIVPEQALKAVITIEENLVWIPIQNAVAMIAIFCFFGVPWLLAPV